MFHADQAEKSMAYGAQCKSQPTCQRLSTSQSRTPEDISLGKDERGDSMDVSKIPVSYGCSGPSNNNHSK